MFALQLLEERPEFAQEASYKRLATDRRRERVLATLTQALAHPCGAVRDNCMNDLRVVGLPPDAVAQLLVGAIRKSRRAQKWIPLTYLLHSVTAMRIKEADVALAEAVSDLITPTSDLRVVSAAAKCLRRLRSSSDRIASALANYAQLGHTSGLPEVTQTLGRLGVEWAAITQLLEKRIVDMSKGRSSGKASQREINQLYKDVIEALAGAGEHHAEEVCGLLQKALVHPSSEVVCASARALGSIGQSQQVASWVLSRITSRHALPQKLAAITALRALAQGQIEGDTCQISPEVLETFIAALREVSIEVRRAATNEMKLLVPAIVDRDVSEALRELATDARLDVALRLDAAECMTAVYVEALRLGGGSSTDLTMEKVLERRRKHRQQASQEDLEEERRQREMDRHCRASIEAAEGLEETLREMMENGSDCSSGGVSSRKSSEWNIRRRAAHVLVEMAAAARKGTNSRLLTVLLSWAREDVSRAEAFVLLGQLGSRRQRVREVLVDAISDSSDRPGYLEAAGALAQIYAGRGYKGELAVQEAVESALIEMLLRSSDEDGHREGEAMAVRALVALYSPRVMHEDDATDDSRLIEVTFVKPGSLGISFGSRGLDVPPFITAIKPATEAADFEELVYGLVLKKVQDKDVLGFTDAIDYIKNAGRPVSLTFFQPAAKVSSSSNARDGTAGVGDHNDEMMEPPGVDATQEELDAYKEWLLLVHEERKPVAANATVGAGEQQTEYKSLLPQHSRLLLQRLAAFFHDIEMHTLWVLAAKTVMEFTAGPSDETVTTVHSTDLMETAEVAREAGIEALEYTLCHAPSAVVANVAAKALQVLNAQSDALSAHLVTQLGNWPIEEGTIIGALTLHDSAVLRQLLQYAAVRKSTNTNSHSFCLTQPGIPTCYLCPFLPSSPCFFQLHRGFQERICLFVHQAPASGDAATQRRAERARETAVAVLTAIVITTDLQASVCIEVLPTAASGAFLCGPLLRYFRGSRLADSRWRLKESLHMQLLQLQLAYPDCLDVAVLLQVSSRIASRSCLV